MYLHAWKLVLALDETVFSKKQVLYTDKNRTLPWPLSYSPIHTTVRSEVEILLQFCLDFCTSHLSLRTLEANQDLGKRIGKCDSISFVLRYIEATLWALKDQRNMWNMAQEFHLCVVRLVFKYPS